jgi:hypothetical protein
MNDIAIALIGFGGTVACLGLAYWVFQGGRARTSALENDAAAPPPAENSTAVMTLEQVFGRAHTQNEGEPRTEFISREEVLAGAARRASAPTAEPATEFVSRDKIFAQFGATMSSAPGTEVIPQAEILAAADRRAGPPSDEESATEFLSRDDILATADRRPPRVEAPAVADSVSAPDGCQ